MGREKIAVVYPLLYLRAAVVVQARELAEQLYRHVIVGNRGIFLMVKTADEYLVVSISYIRFPPTAFFVQAYTLISAGAIPTRQTVIAVLCRRADAEIASAVVQFVVIDVVADHTRRDIDYLVMHHNSCPANAALGVFFLPAAELPFILREPLVIGRIDYRELALSQRDQSILVARGSSFIHRHLYTVHFVLSLIECLNCLKLKVPKVVFECFIFNFSSL